MPQVIPISDVENLIPTSEYPYAKWPFENFNPVQSKLFEIYEGDTNVAIAASTSAGKTVCSEMYLAYEIRKRGGKGIYVGPLKSLAIEKEQDWTDPNHHFGDLKTFIATGDFRFTANRIKEIEKSDLIVMTPEMLASRCRNSSGDKSQFLKDVGTIVFDESHLLTVPGRGDHIEIALMKLVEINPNVRVVLLSATMPNVDEICGWISKITKRDTYYLLSQYRPCPLNIHYETYFDGESTYADVEAQKIGTACGIVNHYQDDKFLVFTHTKETGNMMVKALNQLQIKSDFHNADLSLKKRMELEEKFKNDKSFRVLVATSTLAWGLNLPARRVIVTGVTRGVQPVENYDIRQMIGRAGRPKYDPRGDAYILIPESQEKKWMHRLAQDPPISSTLLNYVGFEKPKYKILAFHLVAEIHQGNVKTKQGFVQWYKESLSHFQKQDFGNDVIDATLNQLLSCRAIILNENGEYECTAVGRIASMYYYSPFDTSDLKRNFADLFAKNQQENDFCISYALANTDSNFSGIVNKREKDAIFGYKKQLEVMYGKNRITDSIAKSGLAYYNMLKGKRNVEVLNSIMSTLYADSDRTIEILKCLDSMSGRWDKADWFKILALRLKYGVEPEFVELCQIPNIGKVRAQKLKSKNIHTVEDVVKLKPAVLASIVGINISLATESLDGAIAIHLTGTTKG